MDEPFYRKYTPGDYKWLTYMWSTHGSNPPPEDVLSKHGIWIEYKNIPVCCVFMYHTGSSMCMMEFVVSNGDIKRKNRDASLDLMIEKAKQWALENGYKYIYTAISSLKYIKRLEKCGFLKKGTPQQHMFFGVENG